MDKRNSSAGKPPSLMAHLANLVTQELLRPEGAEYMEEEQSRIFLRFEELVRSRLKKLLEDHFIQITPDLINTITDAITGAPQNEFEEPLGELRGRLAKGDS